MTIATTAPLFPASRARRVVRGLHLAGPAGALALAFLVLLVAALVLGPALWDASPETTNLLDKFAGFSRAHPLGTDDFGRDILARLLDGGRRSLLGAVCVLGGCSALGLVVGGVAAVAGPRTDALVARTVDGFLSLPSLVVALGIVGVFGKSFEHLIAALVVTGWPWYARLYRGFVVAERNRGYCLAAAAIGVSPWRIAWRHIGPNIAGSAVVVATVNLGNAVLSLASLSFLGLGVAPPTAEWGAMVSDARFHFQTHPWVIIAPGLAISLTVLAVNVLGDVVRDLADPRRR